MMGTTLTGLAGQLALVVSGPLVARMLTVEDRGALALMTLIPSLLVHVGTLGVPLAVTLEVARSRDRVDPLVRAVAPVGLVQVAAICAVSAVVAVLLFETRSPEVRLAAFVAVAYVPAGVVLQYGLAILQGLQQYRAFNLLRLAPAVLWAMFVIVAFLLPATDLLLLICGWIVGNVVVALLVLAIVRRELRSRSDERIDGGDRRTSTRGLVTFGVRTLVGSLAPLGSMNADQVVVALALSPAALGLYVVASSVCNLPRFVAQSVGLVAYPHVAALTREGQVPATVRIVLTATGVGGMIVLLLAATADIFMPMLFGPSYADAVPVTRVLLVSAFLFGVRGVLADSLRGVVRPTDGTVAEVVAWLVFGTWLVAWWGRIDIVQLAVGLVIAAGVSLLATVLIAFERLRVTGYERSLSPP
jgi:O-antigen/teichoic acid export membrane protein